LELEIVILDLDFHFARRATPSVVEHSTFQTLSAFVADMDVFAVHQQDRVEGLSVGWYFVDEVES